MHLACRLRLLCLLNRSYSVKVNVTLHKPTWSWEQQRLTKTRQRRAERAPSPRSLCRLTWRCQCLQSAWGRSPYHPSCKQREARRHHRQTQIVCLCVRVGVHNKHKGLVGGEGVLGSWHGRQAALHYLQICVIKITSEAQNNRGGEETGYVWQLARDTGPGSPLNEKGTPPPHPTAQIIS